MSDKRFPKPRIGDVKEGFWKNCCDVKRQVALPFTNFNGTAPTPEDIVWHWACKACANSSPYHRGKWSGYGREELQYKITYVLDPVLAGREDVVNPWGELPVQLIATTDGYWVRTTTWHSFGKMGTLPDVNWMYEKPQD